MPDDPTPPPSDKPEIPLPSRPVAGGTKPNSDARDEATGGSEREVIGRTPASDSRVTMSGEGDSSTKPAKRPRRKLLSSHLGPAGAAAKQEATDKLLSVAESKRLIERKADFARKRDIAHSLSRRTKMPHTLASQPSKDMLNAPSLAFDRHKLEAEEKLLERAWIEQLRDLFVKDFWSAVTLVFCPETWQAHYTEAFHKPYCELRQNLPRGENSMFLFFRMARKSFLFTVYWCVWRIVCDPNIRLLLVGSREETVLPFARLIRSAFIPGTSGFETFQKVFPEFVIKEKRLLLQTSQFTTPMRNVALPDPTFRATYLGVSAAFRCDELLLDDAIERRNVSDAEMAVMTLRKIMDLFPFVDRISSKYAHVMCNGTRFAFFDPYGVMCGEQHEELSAQLGEVQDAISKHAFNTVIRHIMEEPDTLCDVCPKHIVAAHPHGRPSMSESARPPMSPIITRTMVDEMYNQYLVDQKLGESEFWHQLMNVCLSPSQQKLKPEWFDVVLDRPYWPSARKRAICLDDASKDLQKSGVGDYSVALFGEFSDDGRLMLVYGLRDDLRKWTRDEFIRKIISWCQASNWWPAQIVKEKASTDNFLIDLQRAFNDVSRPVHITVVARGQRGKQDWILGAVQGPLERAEIVFGRVFPEPLRLRLKSEGSSLGRIAHEDAIDALSLFFTKDVRIAGQP